MADEKKRETASAESALYFDGSDVTKWPDWQFKMLAYAAKKGHKKAFLEDLEVPSDKSTWSEDNKTDHELMEAAWSQLALVVHGHALKSVRRIKSEDPKEAWDKLREEFEPSEIVDVADLNMTFMKLTLDSPTENPTDWIEQLEENNEKVGAIEEKYFKDDFLMITHIFSLLPKDKYVAYITANKSLKR